MALPDLSGLDPRYIEAARLRILEGKGWQEVADALRLTTKTIYNWRRTQAWQQAVWATLSVHAGQYTEVALTRLASSAMGEPGSPGVTAANSLLDRIMGTVAQRIGLGGDGNAPPIQTEQTGITEVVIRDFRDDEARPDSGDTGLPGAATVLE